jgi:hypothetical protein
MKAFFTDYFKRLKENCRTWEVIIWWIFRGLMIYALIQSLIDVANGTRDMSDPLQVLANLAGMFAWEIFMIFPEKSMLRHIPSYIQIVSIIMLFCGSFGGKFLNLYYELRLWDSAMHFVSGVLTVLLGYQVVVAMQKRDKVTCSVPIALLCALGFSFFVSTCWELFEFTTDQVMSNAETGAIGDAQHWSYALAQGTPKDSTLFDTIYPERWPLMDTMGDIILNSVGALIAWVGLKIFPFLHKGKNDINNEIEALTKAEKKQTVRK